MKKIYVFLFLILCTIMQLEAQWQRSNGPYGGDISSFAVGKTRIYANERNHGLFISNDNDESSWTQYFYDNNSLKVLYADTNKSIIYAEYNSVLCKSYNEGKTWIETNLKSECSWMTVIGNSIFAATSKGLFKSEDEGESWTYIGMKYRFSYHSIEDIPLTVVGIGNRIFANFMSGLCKSDNGGVTWDTLPNFLGSSYVKGLTTMGATIYAAVNNIIYKSEDNGDSWIIICQYSYGDPLDCRLMTAGSVLYSISGSGVFKSEDGGVNWVCIFSAYDDIGNGCFATKGEDFYGISFYRTIGLLKYDNSENKWIQLGVPYSMPGCRLIAGSNKCYSNAGYGNIHISEDNGKNWKYNLIMEQFPLNINDTVYLIPWRAVSIGNTLYSLSTEKHGYNKSEDFGITWKFYPFPVVENPNFITCCKTINTTLYLGISDGRIYQSDDGGATFSELQSKSFDKDYVISDIYLINNSIIILTNTGVYKHSEDSVGWEKIFDIVASDKLKAFLTVSEENIYLATSKGSIMKSEDLGTTWTKFVNGFPDTDINTIISVGNLTLIGTQENGLYSCKKGDTAWVRMETYSPQDAINSIVHNSTTLLALVEGAFLNRPFGGVMYMPLPIHLSAPNLISPNFASIDIQINPTLYWDTYENAIGYRIQLFNNSDTTVPIKDIKINSVTTFQPPTLIDNRTHYWRVKAYTLTDSSNWSQLWKFTTKCIYAITPQQIEPYNDDGYQIDINPKLIWHKSKAANQYRIQFALDCSFESILKDTIVKDTVLNINNLKYRMKYFWRVQANNDFGSSPWSSTWSFITDFNTPEIPQQFSPLIYETDISIDPKLTWGVANKAIKYRLQFDSIKDFKNPLIDQIFTIHYLQLNGLKKETKYYWRLQSINETDSSKWASTWDFTTGLNIPNETVLITPLDQSKDQSIDLKLKWLAASKAIKYRVQIANNTEILSPIIDTIVSDIFLDVEGLQKETNYYWRVQAQSSTDTSSWTLSWRFITGLNIPSRTILISPQPLDKNIPIDPTLIWRYGFKATKYRIQVDTNKSINSPLIDKVVKDTLCIISDLQKNTKYYWRVQSQSSTDTSSWSPTWSFTTGTTADVAESNNETISISPQPVSNEAVVTCNVENANAGISIELYDLKGTIVATYNFTSLSEGTNKLRLDVSNIPSGMYNVVIKNGAAVHTAKLIKVD